MVYQDSRPPAPLALKDDTKFEILSVKIFHLKQKTNEILPATKEKNQILSFQENSPMFLQTINLGNHMFK